MFCESNTWLGVINFQSNGRIGIGTTTPGYTLDVAGVTRTRSAIVDYGSGSANAVIDLVGRYIGTAYTASIYANNLGGFVLIPNAGDPTLTIGGASPVNGNTLAIAVCFASAERRRRGHQPFIASGDGLANLFGRRIQKGLGEVGVVDDAR
jgi:hypothetical protein